MFHVHEDRLLDRRDSKLKIVIPKKCLKNNEIRSVLQPLENFPNNLRISKNVTNETKDKENCILPKVNLRAKTTVTSPCAELVTRIPCSTKINVVKTHNAIEIEYEANIWGHLRLREQYQKIKPHYMTKQLYLSWDMRSVLIDWLVSVAQEYKMNEQTIHLSINYLDRFLSSVSVIREKFQLVGATAMMLAGKVEEVYPPNCNEWAQLTCNTFSTRQILKMEQLMLRILNFDLYSPTTIDFIRHICVKQNIDKKTMFLAQYLSELVLLEGDEYLKHLPSELAAASLYLARHTLLKSEPWTKNLEKTAGYSKKQLSPVVIKQHKTFKSSPFKEQQAIQKKYSSNKYHRVACLKPRILELDEEE